MHFFVATDEAAAVNEYEHRTVSVRARVGPVYVQPLAFVCAIGFVPGDSHPVAGFGFEERGIHLAGFTDQFIVQHIAHGPNAYGKIGLAIQTTFQAHLFALSVFLVCYRVTLRRCMQIGKIRSCGAGRS